MKAKEFMESNVIPFPLEKRGKMTDPITGKVVDMPDPNAPPEYLVVDDEGMGYSTKTNKREAEQHARMLRIKGINAFVIEL